MERPQKLSPEEAKAKILIILADGDVIPTDHCEDEMFEASADIADVLNVLETGKIIKHEWDEEHQNWKYRVKGTDVGGDDLTAITVIVESDLQLIIITVF